MDELLLNFVAKYKTLTEKEKIFLGQKFNQLTGGKLSPYTNPISVAVGVCEVIDEKGQSKLLAIKRGTQPHINEFAFPGGFQENGESLFQTVSRELKEETNLNISSDNFVIFNIHRATNGNNLIFFKTKYPLTEKFIKENFKQTSEALEYVLIDENFSLCFETHNLIVNEFFNSGLKVLTKHKKRNNNGIF